MPWARSPTASLGRTFRFFIRVVLINTCPNIQSYFFCLSSVHRTSEREPSTVNSLYSGVHGDRAWRESWTKKRGSWGDVHVAACLSQIPWSLSEIIRSDVDMSYCKLDEELGWSYIVICDRVVLRYKCLQYLRSLIMYPWPFVPRLIICISLPCMYHDRVRQIIQSI